LTAANAQSLWSDRKIRSAREFIYEVTAGGHNTSLYKFLLIDGGSKPVWSASSRYNGNLYGQLEYSAGGVADRFSKLSNGISSFGANRAWPAKLGRNIILGTPDGSTSVRFNAQGERSAWFSDTEITGHRSVGRELAANGFRL